MQNEAAKMIAEAQKMWDEREQMRINKWIENARSYLNSDEEVEDFKNTPKSMQLMIMWQHEELDQMYDQIESIRDHLDKTPI
tara:strand:+ start:249 stop:494 length:246 start_codon:yes stop_codon:yes gene_type:complete